MSTVKGSSFPQIPTSELLHLLPELIERVRQVSRKRLGLISDEQGSIHEILDPQ